jgi:hypothetical protein
MTEHDEIRRRLLAGVITDAIGDKPERLDALQASEWSPEFEGLMRNRLVMGRYRYGRMDRADDRNYDRVGSILRRLGHYQRTGNLEHLVDAANLCLMEFVHTAHPGAHFSAADDGEHTLKG